MPLANRSNRPYSARRETLLRRPRPTLNPCRRFRLQRPGRVFRHDLYAGAGPLVWRGRERGDGSDQFSQLLGHYWLRTAGDGRLPPAYEFVVMPNHVHGIVWLPARPTSAPWPIAVGTRRPFSQEDIASLSSRDWSRGHSDQTDASPLQHHDEGLRSAVGNQRRSLGTLVGAFKSMATRKINILRGTPGPSRLATRLSRTHH